MKVLQVLPSLNSGGVERGTLDFAAELVRRGHQSLVMSAGGRLVEQLEQSGSEHITFSIDKKSLSLFFRIKALRSKIIALKPDVIHVRSRIPAWMIWLALRKIPEHLRPALVSTFHGLYSVSRYSEIMGCGDKVIAISHCVKDYITSNYPRINADKITVIHRGVDISEFNVAAVKPERVDVLLAEYPQFTGKKLLLLPGRLSRWKGQLNFVDLMAALKPQLADCHGIILGDPTPGKAPYRQEIIDAIHALGLENDVTLIGHSSDMVTMYAASSLVLNLSQKPEPFGRTVIEALAMGVPVVSLDAGGPAESLHSCFPVGLVPPNDQRALVDTVLTVLNESPAVSLEKQFTLDQQASSTLAVYQQAIESRMLEK